MDDKVFKNTYPQRLNLRLHCYDYTSQGAYFVTICTYNKLILFGQIENDIVVLNRFGEMVGTVWKELPLHYPGLKNEVFIVMPNHVHGIIEIQDEERAGSKPAPTNKPLSEIVRAFKTYSSRKINEFRKSQGIPVWQRGYYEHVIRNESSYQEIGQYIIHNPAKWATDPENPFLRPISSPM